MRPFLTILLAALIAAATAWGVTRWSASSCRVASGHLDDPQFLTKALGLSPEQAAEVQKLAAGYRGAVQGCQERECSLRCTMGAALFREDPDSPQVQALVEQICRERLQSDLATIRHIHQVHALLTPTQQARYEQLVMPCVCTNMMGART